MKNWYLIIAVLFLLFACKGKQLPKTDTEIVQQATAQWNNVLAKQQLDSLSILYADSVILYGKYLGKNRVITEKQSFINKYPDFTQKIVGNLDVQRLDDNRYKVNFEKQAIYCSDTVVVQAYLIFERQKNDQWLIVAESDAPTDKKLAKLSEDEARKEEQERNAINVEFEQRISVSGKLATTSYSDASGNNYTVYILTLDNPLNVAAPNENYDEQRGVKEIQVGFEDGEEPQSFVGRYINISGDIYGEETIHDRRPVVMIHAKIQK